MEPPPPPPVTFHLHADEPEAAAASLPPSFFSPPPDPTAAPPPQFTVRPLNFDDHSDVRSFDSFHNANALARVWVAEIEGKSNDDQQQQQQQQPNQDHGLRIIAGSADDLLQQQQLIHQVFINNVPRAPPLSPPRSAEPPSSSASSSAALHSQSAREQRPLPTPRIWLGVPKEIVRLMAAYMDGHSLARFAGTDKLNSEVASDPRLWDRINDLPVSYGSEFGQAPRWRQEQPRRWFGERWRSAIEANKQKRTEFEKRTKNTKQSNRAYVVHYLTDFLFAPIVSILITLGVILLVWQWETTGGTVDLLSLWPLCLLVLYLIFVLSVYCYTRMRAAQSQRALNNAYVVPAAAYAASDPDHSRVLPLSYYDDTKTPLKEIIDSIQEEGCVSLQGILCLAFLLLALFIVLLAFRVAQVTTADWAVVFVPLYVGFVLVGLLSLYFEAKGRKSGRGGYRYRKRCGCCVPSLVWLASGWVAVGVPLLVFCILLHVKLQYDSSVHLPVYAVCMPLFFIDASTLFYAVYSSVKEEDWPRLMAFLLAWIFFFGPGLVFKILLSLSMDVGGSHVLRVAYLFIPLFVLVAWCIWVSCMLTVQIHEDAEWDEWKEGPEEWERASIQMPVV